MESYLTLPDPPEESDVLRQLRWDLAIARRDLRRREEDYLELQQTNSEQQMSLSRAKEEASHARREMKELREELAEHQLHICAPLDRDEELMRLQANCAKYRCERAMLRCQFELAIKDRDRLYVEDVITRGSLYRTLDMRNEDYQEARDLRDCVWALGCGISVAKERAAELEGLEEAIEEFDKDDGRFREFYEQFKALKMTSESKETL